MEKDFAEWLRTERERLGLTQQDVAVMTGMAVSAIGAIEQGRAKARRSTVTLIKRTMAAYDGRSATHDH